MTPDEALQKVEGGLVERRSSKRSEVPAYLLKELAENDASSSAIALPLVNSDGWIIDTPGIRAFGLSHLNKDRIIESFPEIYQVTQSCMPNCSHSEASCALNAWIESDAAAKSERLIRVTSLRSLLEVKPADEER